MLVATTKNKIILSQQKIVFKWKTIRGNETNLQCGYTVLNIHFQMSLIVSFFHKNNLLLINLLADSDIIND